MRLLITPRIFENNVEQLISVEKKYYPFFKKFGHDIHMIPLSGMGIEEYFDWMKPDGVVFGGGYRMYTKEIKKFEARVLELSPSKKLPILAICCGMWTVNYYFSGTLKFDESHQAFDGVKIVFGKRKHRVTASGLVKRRKYTVNTSHSKVIDSLGENLEKFLVAEDDVVEGVFNLDKKIIGIQFHMEDNDVSGSLTRQIMSLYKSL